MVILALFCSNVLADEEVMRFRVESKGGPTTAFWTFSNCKYEFQKGDYLEYDVYLKSKKPGIGGIDVVTNSAMNLSSFTAADQNNISANAAGDLSSAALGKWYHRKIKIPDELIGEKSSEWLVTTKCVMETNEKAEAAYKNIRITNSNKLSVSIYTTGQIPLNRIYFVNEAAAKEAILTSYPLNKKIHTMLDWFQSTLPLNKYIGMHAEHYDIETKKWVSGCPNMQPFKSIVFKPWNVAFFRKDAIEFDFYGELFTYDFTTLRLHTETMPPRAEYENESQPAWDPRPDRVRVFVQTSNGYDNWFTDKTIVYDWEPTSLARFKTGNSKWKFWSEQNVGDNWAIGRAIAPVNGDVDWNFHGTLNTYMANNYDHLSNGTAPLIQLSINDHVTVTKIKNFNTVYDGICEGWEPDPEFVNFDEAFAINQHMNNNSGRERFIFARKGNKHYGIVRWDNAIMIDGKWVIVDRATGLREMDADDGFTFNGMYERVMNDKWISPLELDMHIPEPKFIPSRISGDFNLPIQNTGLKTWKSGEIKLYGRLMDKTWQLIPNSEKLLAEIGNDVKTLDICLANVTIPSEWNTGDYYLVLELKDGEKPFSSVGSIPFVKEIKIK